MSIIKKFSTTIIFTLSAAFLQAQELENPMGDVVLTISGDVTVSNVDGTAQLDITQLRELPQIIFSTETIWTEGVSEFSGPSLKSILDLVGVSSGNASAVAINDYAVEIPVESLTDTAPIVAIEMNGQEMSVREKGPLWVIYPYDDDPSFRSEVIYSRSIWQLDRIVAN